jgi:GT2 family glycosyltransferase
MNRVVIIILNWNGIQDTLKCLDSLQSQTYQDYKILVVDNGSTDQSHELLNQYQRQHKNIEIIYNDNNLGFAGGVNVGIHYAINNDFEYVALFNNDAIADKNWLKELVHTIKQSNIGIVTGLLLRRDGLTIDSTGDWYSKWGLPFPRDRNRPTEQAPDSGLVFGATGGASLYKIKMIKQIGLFDETFFAYYEDVDVSFRAQLHGWKVYYTSKAIAYHEQGSTSNKISGFAIYQTFKNLPLLFIKNVPRGLLFSTGWRFALAYKLMFWNAVFKGIGRPAWRGWWKAIRLIPSALHERRIIQKGKSVSNKYIKDILWPDLPPDQTGLRKMRNLFTGKK